MWCIPLNCTFSKNEASRGGGGMNNSNSSPTVTNCTFSGNSSLHGGGMDNSGDSNPPVAESSFCGNEPDHIFGPWTDEGGNEFCCPADLDDSGVVDVEDLLLVLDAWDNKGGPEDLDGSGFVDIGDILAVLAAWGPCP